MGEQKKQSESHETADSGEVESLWVQVFPKDWRAHWAIFWIAVFAVLTCSMVAVGASNLSAAITQLSFCLAAGACGVFVGFIFGIPKTRAPGAKPSLENPSDSNGAQESHLTPKILANTNLEEISDWLTKILVGVGLTQFAQIKATFKQIGLLASAGFKGTWNPLLMSYSTLTYFSVLGFLLGWLATRLFLSKAMLQADSEEKVAKLDKDLATAVILSMSPATKNILEMLDRGEFDGTPGNEFDLTHDDMLGTDLEYLYQRGFIEFTGGIHGVKELPSGQRLTYDLGKFVRVTQAGKDFLRLYKEKQHEIATS